MFGSLRENSLLYILEKGEQPTLKIAQVVSRTNPVPKFNTSFPSNPLTQAETTVDVVAKCGDQSYKFEQLNSNLQISNYNNGTTIVSESRDAMNAEVEAMIRNSKQIVESAPLHEKIISAGEDILKQLNPQFARDKERDEELSSIKSQVKGIESKLDKLLEAINTKQ